MDIKEIKYLIRFNSKSCLVSSEETKQHINFKNTEELDNFVREWELFLASSEKKVFTTDSSRIRDVILLFTSILLLISGFIIYLAFCQMNKYFVYNTISFSGNDLLYFILGTLLLINIMAIPFLVSNVYRKIVIRDDVINIYSFYGNMKTLWFDDITTVSFLNINRYEISIYAAKKYKKIRHLERLSYWPVLKIYLLKKIEESNKFRKIENARGIFYVREPFIPKRYLDKIN